MSDIIEIIKTLGIGGGLLFLLFRWMTKDLIPQLQKERSEAIQSFEKEMAYERTLHRDMFERMADDCRSREERLVGIVDKALPAMAEAINNCAKTVTNHDTMTQVMGSEARTAFAHIKREHDEMATLLKGRNGR